MTEYKAPKTRIKVVEDGDGPQHLVVIIPFILWGWEPIYGDIGNPEHLPTLGEAKGRIDRLTRHKRYWLSDIEWKARKKAKKKVSVIDVGEWQ